jgi:hypothetical protein
MGSRIDELLEKYWQGETTLQEEKELKEHFKASGDVSATSQYMNMLSHSGQKESNKPFTHPGKKIRQTWLSIAASIVLGVSVAFWVLNDARNQREYVIDDPQEAYEMTRKALFMMSATLNEGASYSQPLTKINEVQELIKETKDDSK